MSVNPSNRALGLYRQLVRCSRTWMAKDESNTQYQREYILEETRRLFRANKTLTDPQEVEKCMVEAEARLEIAHHYQDPFPRPSYLPPKTLTRTTDRNWGTANIKRKDRSRPVYLNSLDHEAHLNKTEPT